MTPQTVTNYTKLWIYAADAIWKDSSLRVKDSTGYSITRDTELPPPVAIFVASVPESPASLATAQEIMNMITPSRVGTNIQAGEESKESAAAKKAASPKPAANCETHTCKYWKGTDDFYCDLDYKTCSGGIKKVYPGCVKRCPRYSPYTGVGGCPEGSRCEEDGDVDEVVVFSSQNPDYTYKGYCKSKLSESPYDSFKCGEVQNKLEPGGKSGFTKG